jgi:AraC family transcriptional activator of tynA and feaB
MNLQNGISVLNLASVAAPERAALWARSAKTFFPGLSVTRPPVNPAAGMIQGVTLGAGTLWTILSPPALVSYVPRARTDVHAHFSLMMQLEGATYATQASRACTLNPGDLCVIDEMEPFELEVRGQNSRIAVLQMPRHAVLSRKSGIEKRTAQAFSAQEPGTMLLRNLVKNLVDSVQFLESDQRAAALASVIHMLAAPKLPGGDAPSGRIHQRIAATLAFIDAELSDPSLTAQRVACAQGLSRRRLDQILLGNLGTSLSAQIWARRLTQAASDLLDPRFAHKTVTEIAFGVGFEDAAHFARAFKRRYHCTPRAWRARMEVGTRREERAALSS